MHPMGGLRVRWRTVARAAALVVLALIALRALPSLLGPGPPPPLATDIGLANLSRPRSGCPLAGCPRDEPEASPNVRVWPARALRAEKRAPDSGPRHPPAMRRGSARAPLPPAA